MRSPAHKAQINIAAAIITDGRSKTLLVRKAGTDMFMQPGGKINQGETPQMALIRELDEELGVTAPESALCYCGRFEEAAAFEPATTLVADLFYAEITGNPSPRAEIEECLWVNPSRTINTPLAPLTRNYALPLARKLMFDGQVQTPLAHVPKTRKLGPSCV